MCYVILEIGSAGVVSEAVVSGAVVSGAVVSEAVVSKAVPDRGATSAEPSRSEASTAISSACVEGDSWQAATRPPLLSAAMKDRTAAGPLAPAAACEGSVPSAHTRPRTHCRSDTRP